MSNLGNASESLVIMIKSAMKMREDRGIFNPKDLLDIKEFVDKVIKARADLMWEYVEMQGGDDIRGLEADADYQKWELEKINAG